MCFLLHRIFLVFMFSLCLYPSGHRDALHAGRLLGKGPEVHRQSVDAAGEAEK